MKKEISIHSRMSRLLAGIKQRCNNPKTISYKRYGGRGIKNLLNRKDLIYLWKRDKAHLLNRPSIDRIDNDGNYEMSNCRFIESSENARKHFKFKKISILCIETGEIFNSYQEMATRFARNIKTCRCYFNRKPPGGFINYNDLWYFTLKRFIIS